jgi:hypothetical protein
MKTKRMVIVKERTIMRKCHSAVKKNNKNCPKEEECNRRRKMRKV